MPDRLLRRAWRVYADPASSPVVTTLKWLIPLETAAFIYRLAAPADWPHVGTTLFELVLLWVLLVVIRQRDEARADAARRA